MGGCEELGPGDGGGRPSSADRLASAAAIACMKELSPRARAASLAACIAASKCSGRSGCSVLGRLLFCERGWQCSSRAARLCRSASAGGAAGGAGPACNLPSLRMAVMSCEIRAGFCFSAFSWSRASRSLITSRSSRACSNAVSFPLPPLELPTKEDIASAWGCDCVAATSCSRRQLRETGRVAVDGRS